MHSVFLPKKSFCCFRVPFFLAFLFNCLSCDIYYHNTINNNKILKLFLECTPDLQKRVGGGTNSTITKAAAANLRPMAMLPMEIAATSTTTKSKPIPINNKPGPSSAGSAASFNDFRPPNHRGIKRTANSIHSTSSSWTDDETASILSMATKFSTSTISDRRKASISIKPIITSSNDPSDVLLHQLTQVCEQAQKTVAIEPSNNRTINTMLESDRKSSTLKSTKLANHFISCFVIGGEIRLCSPQIYSVIMKDVHEDDVCLFLCNIWMIQVIYKRNFRLHIGFGNLILLIIWLRMNKLLH